MRAITRITLIFILCHISLKVFIYCNNNNEKEEEEKEKKEKKKKRLNYLQKYNVTT